MFTGILIGAGVGLVAGSIFGKYVLAEYGSVKAHITAEFALIKSSIADEFTSLRSKL